MSLGLMLLTGLPILIRELGVGINMIFKILLLILLIASPCFAQEWQEARMLQGIVASGVSVACTTGSDSKIIDEQIVGAESTYFDNFQAAPFTLAATTTITEYRIYGADGYADNDPNGIVTVQIWNGDATDPVDGGAITGTDVTYGAGTYPFDLAKSWVTFTLATPTQLAAGTYWLVMTHSAAYPYWGCHYLAGKRRCKDADGAGAWTCADDYGRVFEVWGCTP